MIMGLGGGPKKGKMRIQVFPVISILHLSCTIGILILFIVSLFSSLKTTMDESAVENTWSSLKNAIQKILVLKNYAEFSFEVTHLNAYNMFFRRHGEKLYNSIQEVVTHHLELVVIFNRVKILFFHC